MRNYKYVRVAQVDDDEDFDKATRQTADWLREEILHWFRRCSENEAVWVLNRVAEHSPHLFADVLEKRAKWSSVVDSVSFSANNCTQRFKRKKIEGEIPGHPIVQFSSSVFYAQEGVDNVLVLDVMRIGCQECTSEVFYETEDDSAQSGRSYIATSGKLVFEPGVAVSHIKVQIIDNDLWDTTTEFKCRLKEEGLKNAVLGRYLHCTRVKIIDNDCFPSNRFEDLSTPEKVAECHKWSLLIGYFQMISRIPGVFASTVKYVLIEIILNLWKLITLLMTTYIIDRVLDTSSPTSDLFFFHDRRQSLILCAFVTVLSVFSSHVLDYARMSFPIARPARCFVQSALLRKFLNYKRVIREGLAPGTVVMGMQRDAVDLVYLGFFNMIEVYCSMGHMVCMLGFQLTAPILFVRAHDLQVLALVCLLPFLMIAFLRAREGKTGRFLHERNLLLADFTCHIETTVTNHQLVTDYSLRNQVEYKFIDKQRRYSIKAGHARRILKNNEYFCKWCQAIVIAFWILYGGLQVINGDLTVGLFVASLRLFEQLTGAFMEIHRNCVNMMNTFPALENVTTLMNLETDVRHRCRLKHAQQAEAKVARDSLRRSVEINHLHVVPLDLIPIKLEFRCPFKFEGKDCTLNYKGNVIIHQGQLVAVVGPLGCGKATLLRLIVGSVLPANGAESPIFVPSHLRVANVADVPLFLMGTLYENLTFGMETNQPDASHERVRSICKLLTKSHTITDLLDVDVTNAWHDAFSGAECKLLSVARALIHNVEVLCIHKPLSRLNHDEADHVMQALHDHVDKKGLELKGDPGKRRPRTVIVSAGSDRAVQEAHNIILLDPMSGMKLLLPE